MSNYLSRHGSTRRTPQSESMRADQVPNEAGGYVWEADKWSKLRRFLILPEIRFGNPLLYLCEFVCGAGGVKDSSASPSRGARGRRICGAGRRSEGT